MSGFRKFLLRGNVVDLAVAVVIGAAFGAVVTSFVKAFVTPLIGAFGGIPDFSTWIFTVNGSRFAVGEFPNALLSFIVIAAVVYFFVVLPVNKLMERYKSDEPVGPPQRECPRCLSKIPEAASCCAFCTRDVPTADAVAGRAR
jgi:large conductance mechanosensitive channel